MIIFILGLILCCERRLLFRKRNGKPKELSCNDTSVDSISNILLENTRNINELNEENTKLLEEIKNLKETLIDFGVKSIESELAQLGLFISLSKNKNNQDDDPEILSDKLNLAIKCRAEGVELLKLLEQKIRENGFIDSEEYLLTNKIKYQIFCAYLHLLI